MRKSASVLTLVAALLLLVAAGASAQHPTPGSEHGAAAQAHSQPAEAGHGGPAQGDAAAGGIESEQEEQHFELPNFMMYIHVLNREPIDAWLAGINQGLPPLLHIEWVNIENLTYCLIVIIILSTFAITASRKRKLRPESRQYLFMENLLMGLYDFFAQVLGKDTRKYIPLVGTLFIYILCMNLFGLIPLMKSPTSVWGVNAAMALCVFCYVQWTALVRNGVLGYLKHFLGELPSFKEMGCLGYGIIPFLAILNVMLHILEELVKPISLSLRLFGNILGEDTLLAVFAGLVFLIPGVIKLPLHFPFMILALIFSTVQALIFSMLTAVYISLMLPHEEHAH
jgi:F-type H+-transporting ATPase subunit a